MENSERESDRKKKFWSHKIRRGDLLPGNHIYSWRAFFTYAHHGIYVGDNKVIHFTCSLDGSEIMGSRTSPPPSKQCSSDISPPCGYRKPGNGVVLSCLDCFLGKGSLYLFQYGVAALPFCCKIRGGTCTTAESDFQEKVIHRAEYLLQNGYRQYNLFTNNCEDFALYCKTGLVVRTGGGKSGQIKSMTVNPMAFMLSGVPAPYLIMASVVAAEAPELLPAAMVFALTPAGIALIVTGAVAVGVLLKISYRYSTDIGVRSDVVKIRVEEMADFVFEEAPVPTGGPNPFVGGQNSHFHRNVTGMFDGHRVPNMGFGSHKSAGLHFNPLAGHRVGMRS